MEEQVQLQAARHYVRTNLYECCLDIEILQSTGVLPKSSHFAVLRELCSFSGTSSFALAEGLVKGEAIQFVLDNSKAKG